MVHTHPECLWSLFEASLLTLGAAAGVYCHTELVHSPLCISCPHLLVSFYLPSNACCSVVFSCELPFDPCLSLPHTCPRCSILDIPLAPLISRCTDLFQSSILYFKCCVFLKSLNLLSMLHELDTSTIGIYSSART